MGRPRLWKWLSVVAGVGLVVVVLPTSPGRHEMAWMDPVDGAIRRQSTDYLGRSGPMVVTDTPLGRRFRAMGLSWTPDWRLLHDREISVTGRTLSRACGSAPPIYTLAGLPEVQEAYIRHASDDDLRQLLRILSTGDEQQQREAIEAVSEVGLSKG